ncbi:MAG: multidrug transporter MatE [Lachnospiraceae bacterium]|nr:multidrug transporter MatE [Lachnospiraceae bacterium]
MELLTSKIKPMYFKYLTAAFGSALISSIYGVVDMAMVGQYQGPEGTAALAVAAPVWSIVYSLGFLMGIGGSVLFTTLRGNSEKNQKKSNEYFTTALIGAGALAAATWLAVIFFDQKLLRLFGAEDTLLPLARSYLLPVKFVVPSFLFVQLMAAFLRNDGAPSLAAKAVLTGGIFNVFGDYFFVFALNLGIMGAGLATAIGSVLSLLVMLTHFLSKKCTLRIVKPVGFFLILKSICVTGFSAFFIDVAMGILTTLFNRQILKYLGTDALAVYGIIININTFVQCCAYSIGQASQPMLSMNFGAGKGERIVQILKYALETAAVFGLIWAVLAALFPNFFVRIFMTPTEEILVLAPDIIRSYGISFLLLPFNIFSTYYFQALMRPMDSFIVSVSRGAVVSGLLICILPVAAGADAIWFAMPITELLVAIYVIRKIIKYTKALS